METKDYDNETNLENYDNRPKFSNFIVPDGNETVMITADWKEAAEFAIDEATDEELAEISIKP